MTENMAARGEGLVGRTMAQIEMRNACFRDMLGLIKACHSDAPENSTGKEALTALYDSIQSQGVEGFGAALEAAAPASTAQSELLCVNCGHSYAQHTKGIDHQQKYCRHCPCLQWAALATPSPQAPQCTCYMEANEATNAPCPIHNAPAATQEPAGSETAHREWIDVAKEQGCECGFSDAWRCARKKGITTSLTCYCPCHKYISAPPGSPRKVGEDGALAKEIAADLEDAGLVEPGLCGIKAMEIIARRLRSSSVPVGEQKQEEGV